MTIKVEITNPIAPVIKPAIAIPLLIVLIPKIPNVTANIPQGIDIYHKQKNTKATIPNTKEAIQNPFFSFFGSSTFFVCVSSAFVSSTLLTFSTSTI